MSHRRNYSPAEDDVIRSRWPDVDAIAAQLGRTRLAVGARGKKLNLPWRRTPIRRFSAAERQAVIDRYPTEGAKPLAREFGRTREDLVAFAQRIGVIFHRRWSADEDRRLIALKRAAKSLPAIADELGRTLSAVSKRAELLGLTALHYDPEQRRRELVATRRPPRQTCEIRWAKARMAMGEHGWPPDLNPKELAILDSLWRNGPQSRRNLATSIGEPKTRNPHKLLMTHGGRSSMARLLARGLVACLPMQDGRSRVFVYTLTAVAMQSRGTFGSVTAFNAPIAAMRIRIPRNEQERQLEAAA